MTAFNFNANSVAPDSGRVGALPAGWYASMLTKTEIKPTNGGGGAYIAVQGQVSEGPHKGASWFTNFNIQNANEKAVEIGMAQLSSLCHATGVMQFSDTDQLKNKPFYVRLKLVPAELNEPGNPASGVKYEEKNEVMAYRAITDQAAMEAAKNQAVAKTPAGAQVPPQQPPAFVPPQQQMQQQAAPVQQQQQWNQQPQQQQAPQQQQWSQQPQPQAPQQQAPQQQPPASWQGQQQQQQQQQAPVQQQQAPAAEAQPAWAQAGAAQPWAQQQAPQQQQQQQAPAGPAVDPAMPAWMQGQPQPQ